jgi:DNA-binding transcriptional MerR regulator
MKQTDRFSLEEICVLAGLPRRTVRYYIQQEIVDRPKGAKRGSYYTRDHLEQLLTIRKWQRAGLNLERIRELVADPGGESSVPPERTRRPGEVSVRSHITLGPGVELVVDPGEASLAPEDVRALAQQAGTILYDLKGKKS